jgi:hypothetical protein
VSGAVRSPFLLTLAGARLPFASTIIGLRLKKPVFRALSSRPVAPIGPRRRLGVHQDLCIAGDSKLIPPQFMRNLRHANRYVSAGR